MPLAGSHGNSGPLGRLRRPPPLKQTFRDASTWQAPPLPLSTTPGCQCSATPFGPLLLVRLRVGVGVCVCVVFRNARLPLACDGKPGTKCEMCTRCQHSHHMLAKRHGHHSILFVCRNLCARSPPEILLPPSLSTLLRQLESARSPLGGPKSMLMAILGFRNKRQVRRGLW